MRRAHHRSRAEVEPLAFTEPDRFLDDLLGEPVARSRRAPSSSLATGDPQGAWRVFDAIAHGGGADEEVTLPGLPGRRWRIVGRPGEPVAVEAMHVGDLVIRRALGEGRLAAVRRVAEHARVAELHGADGRLRGDTLVLRAIAEGGPSAWESEPAADESFPSSGIDAAVMWSNDKAYFFKGDQYVRYSIADDWADEGYPAKIKGSWPGLFERDIDAAILWNNGKAYFFKGDEYIGWEVATNKVASPRKISDGWPGLFARGIDAAVMWNDGKAYFFKGDQYIGWKVSDDTVDPPKKIKDDWPGLWERGIDAAIMWNDGKAYFFKGDQYVRVAADRRVDPGYPAKIKGRWPARPWTWLPRAKRPAARRAARGAFPARPTGALGGSAFIATIQGEQPPANWRAREKAIFKEIVRGNVPDALVRGLVRVDLEVVHKGQRITGSVQVMPDYLCIGEDGDYVYIPMDPLTAQRIAFELDMNLPTARICHAIWKAAGRMDPKRQLEAQFRDYQSPSRPNPRRAQTSTAAYAEHSDAIKAQMAGLGLRLGDFVAGHKKDVVLSKELHKDRLRIAFHGFYKDGKPTEPCRETHHAHNPPGCMELPALGHGWEKNAEFSDYSQGVRLVSNEMIVDGTPMSMRKVLSDPVRAFLISADGPIDPPYIPEPPDAKLAAALWEADE